MSYIMCIPSTPFTSPCAIPCSPQPKCPSDTELYFIHQCSLLLECNDYLPPRPPAPPPHVKYVHGHTELTEGQLAHRQQSFHGRIDVPEGGGQRCKTERTIKERVSTGAINRIGSSTHLAGWRPCSRSPSGPAAPAATGTAPRAAGSGSAGWPCRPACAP